jgi:hypothetical protein
MVDNEGKNADTLGIYNTGHTQKNGAVSTASAKKPHHSFVYALYIMTALMITRTRLNVTL